MAILALARQINGDSCRCAEGYQTEEAFSGKGSNASVSPTPKLMWYTMKRSADLLIVKFHKFTLQERHKTDFSVGLADSFDDTADFCALIFSGGPPRDRIGEEW
jgi:hypothetical protein